MDTLQITLFGHVTVIHPNCTAPLKLSRGSQALLAYLLLQPHLVPRDVLMEVFWTDSPPDRAQSNLTTAIWRLRQLLEPEHVHAGTYLITSNTGEVGFNWASNYWLDTKSFEEQICPFLRRPLSTLDKTDISKIENTLTLYRNHGELLEGMYEDWALRERERFRLCYLNCLVHLMAFHADKHEFAESIALGQEILRCDPVREEIHRNLMRIYWESGQRTLAIRQYTHCCDLLSQELGVLPLEETQILYQQIVAVAPAEAPTSASPLNREINKLAHELQLVKHSLDETTRALARITRSMNRLMGETLPSGAGKQKQ